MCVYGSFFLRDISASLLAVNTMSLVPQPLCSRLTAGLGGLSAAAANCFLQGLLKTAKLHVVYA